MKTEIKPPELAGPEKIKANVRLWRMAHGLPLEQNFSNQPRILKISGRNIIINLAYGKCDIHI